MVEQVVVGPQLHVLRRCAVARPGLEQQGVVTRGVQGRVCVFVRPRGAPVVQRPHKRLGERERQHRVAQQPKAPGGRRHETGAFARLVDDFAGRCHAFLAVGGQQALGRGAVDHKGQPPGQGLRVLKPGVGPAHAKNGQQVGRIAHKQHAAAAVIGQGEGAGRVHRAPVHLPRRARMAYCRQLRVDALGHRFGGQRLFGCFVGRQLVVNAPDAVGLAVHQHGVAGVPGGVEKRQPFGGQGQVNADVGNHKLAFVRTALQLQRQQAADAGACTVCRHQPAGGQGVGACGGVHRQRGAAGGLGHAGHAVAPAQFDQRLGVDRVHQVFLQVLLLQVDHGEKAVVRVVRRFHAEHALAPVKRVAKAPGQPVLRHPVGHTHLLQDFHGPAGEHNGPAAFRHLALALQHHAAHAVARQLQRRHQANGPGPGNHHGGGGVGVASRWGQPGVKHLVGVINRAPGFGVGLVHGVSPRVRPVCVGLCGAV